METPSSQRSGSREAEEGGAAPADPTRPPVRFYSQNGEDCLLWRFFGGRRHGCFVDVGAFDGVHLSNTLCFEQQGWRGICVEAHPRYLALCARNRPASVCVHAAVVGEEGRRAARLFVEELGLLSGLGFGERKRKDVARRYERRGLTFQGFREVEVPAATLSGIFGRHPPPGEIDLLSVDVEGHEIEVLRGADLGRRRPRVILVEANGPAERGRVADELVRGAGYHFARQLVENLVFAREREDADALRRVEVACVLEPQLHPLGERYTTPALRAGKAIRIGPADPADAVGPDPAGGA